MSPQVVVPPIYHLGTLMPRCCRSMSQREQQPTRSHYSREARTSAEAARAPHRRAPSQFALGWLGAHVLGSASGVGQKRCVEVGRVPSMESARAVLNRNTLITRSIGRVCLDRL